MKSNKKVVAMSDPESTDVLLEKINNIELNTKIDNFLGYEDLTEEEKKELEKTREEIKKGECVSFEELFGE